MSKDKTEEEERRKTGGKQEENRRKTGSALTHFFPYFSGAEINENSHLRGSLILLASFCCISRMVTIVLAGNG